MNNVDIQYITLAKDILENGTWKETRSGNVISLFDRTMRFNLQEGLPLLTTKKVFTKGAIHELIWFLKGDTNIRYLVNNGVNIWNDDAYRWFKTLDFQYLKIGDPSMIEGYYKLDHILFDLKDLETRYFLFSIDKRLEHRMYSEEQLRNITKDEFVQLVKEGTWLKRNLYYKDVLVHGSWIYRFGDLGDVYGKQWRNFNNANTRTSDQIAIIQKTLKENPNDRRMILSGWNPAALDKVALPACHMFATFYTRPLSKEERLNWLQNNSDNKYDEWKDATQEKLDSLNVPKHELSCSFTMRSNDFLLGNPYNILSYAILTHMFAQCANMTVGELVYHGMDVHIYENHIEQITEQINRDPYKYDLPKLELNKDITDIFQFKYEDVKILDYESYPAIKAPLSVG